MEIIVDIVEFDDRVRTSLSPRISLLFSSYCFVYQMHTVINKL